MPTLTLHITGAFRARLDDAPLTVLSRRGQGLLAYLACQPGLKAERGRMADLMWSDRGEAQARASLRQELSVLRRQLGPDILHTDRNCIWLDDALVVVLRDDAPLLDGFDLASEGFEDWLRMMRGQAKAPAHTIAQTNRPTLAVMPFDALGAADDDMFAVGIVEEITTALSRCGVCDVIARQSAFALDGAALAVHDIASKLGADYIVEGTVQRAGNRVRIAVQLVRGRDGHLLWSARFDDQLDDLFDLQDRIVAQVAGQVAPNLRAAEIERARQLPPTDRSAYELTLNAMPHFWAHNADENQRAMALLSQALDHSPDYAPAMAYKAWCHAHQRCYLWTTDAQADTVAAVALKERAVPLAQDDAPTLVALSAVAGLADNDFEGAAHFVKRALEIDPNNAWGWLRLGWTSVYLADYSAAFAAFDRFETLSPLDPFRFNSRFGRSAAYRAIGDYAKAIVEIELGLRESPGATWVYRMLFGTYWLAGNKDAAMEAARKWRETNRHVRWEDAENLMPKWSREEDYLNALKHLMGDA